MRTRTQINSRQRDFFTSRWLEQVAWMEARAAKAQRLYYRLRLVTVVGAVAVPTLLSLTVYGGSLDDVVKVVALCVSLLVAVCAAVEGFFQFGQRWRSLTEALERLKTEGWLLLDSRTLRGVELAQRDVRRVRRSRRRVPSGRTWTFT